MQQYAGIYLLQIYTTCFGCPSHPSSGAHKTATASLLQVISRKSATTFLHRGLISPNKATLEEGRCTVTWYDLYQRLQLQFYVLVVMGAMDTRNMYGKFAVNKYLHTVAACWILLI